MAVGDAILLRTAISRIRAVGLLAGDYLYVNAFDDVNGWDLQHVRRVRWSELPAEYDFGAPVFGANPPRLSRVANAVVVDYARRYLSSPPAVWQEALLPALPTEEPALESVPEKLQGIVAEVADLYPLLWDEKGFGERPSEDELIAHLVVPLLRLLGWPPERIAVQWRHVDVALFDMLPRVPENCRLVIEAKRFGAGVEGALEQAKAYVAALGIAVDVVVTDGIRYRMYSSRKDFAPLAYANLARLKQSAAELFSRLGRS
jgi:hypothetical protein